MSVLVFQGSAFDKDFWIYAPTRMLARQHQDDMKHFW